MPQPESLPVHIEEKIKDFGDYLAHQKRYSPHTSTAYTNDVAQFFSFILDRFSVTNDTEVKTMMVKSWVYDLTEKKEKPRSINRKLSSLRIYFKFRMKHGVLAVNPADAVKGIKTEKRLVQWVPEIQMEHLLDEVEFGEGFPALRDRLIISLLYGTGMRLAELLGLNERSVSFYEGTVEVLGKRNKQRIIPLTRPLVEEIRKYLAAKKDNGFTEVSLVVTDKGEPAYRMFIQRKVKEFLGKVATFKKLSPHLLRHTYATHLLNKGADINAIKELLGHASLAATQVYTHNSIDQLKKIYKQAHPKAE